MLKTMSLTALLRAGALIPVVLALASCQPGTPGQASVSRTGFKKNYLVARSALESGQYAKASRQYADMLGGAGPLAPRLRLEYAHALLREGKFDKAHLEMDPLGAMAVRRRTIVLEISAIQ